MGKLKVDTKQALAQIQKQISSGEALIAKPISQPKDLIALLAESEGWSGLNDVILKRLYTDDSVFNEYWMATQTAIAEAKQAGDEQHEMEKRYIKAGIRVLDKYASAVKLEMELVADAASGVMKGSTLLQPQKNELADILKTNGLKGTDVYVTFGDLTTGEPAATRIGLKTRPFAFVIYDLGTGRFRFSSGPKTGPEFIDYDTGKHGFYWDQIMGFFSSWCRLVRGELNTPDLLAEFMGQSHTELVEIVSPSSVEMIPFDQQKLLAVATEQFKQQIIELIPDKSSQQEISGKLDVVIGQLGTLSYDSWRAFLLGSVMTFVLANPAAQQQVSVIFNLMGKSIGTVIIKLLGGG